MMRFATDENFNGKMLAGLLLRLSGMDIVRIQDTEMHQAPDPELLEWLAQENRILLTHDVQTMPGFVYERVEAGLSVPDVIAIQADTSIGQAIADLELLILASTPDEFENQVRHIPLP